METNMAENMGDKSVYIRAFWPREINQSSQRSIQSNTTNECEDESVVIMEMDEIRLDEIR